MGSAYAERELDDRLVEYEFHRRMGTPEHIAAQGIRDYVLDLIDDDAETLREEVRRLTDENEDLNAEIRKLEAELDGRE